MAGWLLERLGPSLSVAIPATAAVLIVHQLLVLGLAILGDIDVRGASAVALPFGGAVRARSIGAAAGLQASAIASSACGRGDIGYWSRPDSWLTGCSSLRLEDRIAITAHRGGSDLARRTPWRQFAKQRTSEPTGPRSTFSARTMGRWSLCTIPIWPASGGPAQVRDVTLGDHPLAGRWPIFRPRIRRRACANPGRSARRRRDRVGLTIEFKPHGTRGCRASGRVHARADPPRGDDRSGPVLLAIV